ncbi:MAG: hypothetical protein V8R91_03645 [Butyricimonas faecihominis]
MFAETLKKHLHYRRLLGWSVDPIAYTEEFKKLGINEVSSNKGESDSDYILANGTMYAFVLLVRVFDCDPEMAAASGCVNHPLFQNIFT